MTGSFEISMDEEASPAEVEAVATVFSEAGLDGPVAANIGRRSLGDLPFVIYVGAVPTAFLTAFAAEAGKDAYASLKKFVADVSAARRDRDGSIVVQDRENREDSTVLILSSDLPDDAFEELRDLDLDAVKGAYLVWDRDRDKGWYDPMAR